MFGLGFFEILIIFLVVIVFINPKDLPKVFRRLGRLVRQLRDIRDSSVQYMKRIEREIEAEEEAPIQEEQGGAEQSEP
jgi:Tat protein translocase TatB subunit